MIKWWCEANREVLAHPGAKISRKNQFSRKESWVKKLVERIPYFWMWEDDDGNGECVLCMDGKDVNTRIRCINIGPDLRTESGESRVKKGVETNGLEIRSLLWKVRKEIWREKPPSVPKLLRERRNRHQRWNETKTGVGSGKDVMVLDGEQMLLVFEICSVSRREKRVNRSIRKLKNRTRYETRTKKFETSCTASLLLPSYDCNSAHKHYFKSYVYHLISWFVFLFYLIILINLNI